MAEIHRRQPQRILRPPQVQFALVEFHPHLQHVVLRFEAMLACTLDRTQQLREQRMVTFGHLPHLTRTDHRSVGPRRRDDHLRSGQPPVLLRHFTADPRHAITRAHLAAHVEGLFERYAAAVDPTHLVGEVQAGEERRTARGHPVDTQHGATRRRRCPARRRPSNRAPSPSPRTKERNWPVRCGSRTVPPPTAGRPPPAPCCSPRPARCRHQASAASARRVRKAIPRA